MFVRQIIIDLGVVGKRVFISQGFTLGVSLNFLNQISYRKICGQHKLLKFDNNLISFTNLTGVIRKCFETT